MAKQLKISDEVYTEMLTNKGIQMAILRKPVTWDDFCRTLLELFQESIRGLQLDIQYPPARKKSEAAPEKARP